MTERFESVLMASCRAVRPFMSCRYPLSGSLSMPEASACRDPSPSFQAKNSRERPGRGGEVDPILPRQWNDGPPLCRRMDGLYRCLKIGLKY